MSNEDIELEKSVDRVIEAICQKKRKRVEATPAEVLEMYSKMLQEEIWKAELENGLEPIGGQGRRDDG